MKLKYLLFVALIILSSKFLYASENSSQFLDRDYTMFMIADNRVISIKNLLDFMVLGPFSKGSSTSVGNYTALIELKKVELKHAVIEELKIAGRHVFEYARLSRKKKKWKKMSLNTLFMERDLVIAPFNDIWEEHIRVKRIEPKHNSKNMKIFHNFLIVFFLILGIFIFTVRRKV